MGLCFFFWQDLVELLQKCMAEVQLSSVLLSHYSLKEGGGMVLTYIS